MSGFLIRLFNSKRGLARISGGLPLLPRKLTRALMLILALLAQSPMVVAEDRAAVLGLWASDRSLFELIERDGELLGIIRAINNPTYTREENPDRAGQPRTDDHNPDSTLRSRPMVGISILSDYEYRKGLWQGRIYDPDTGNTYQSRARLARDGRLKIRGYIGAPMFGKSAYFDLASTCRPDIVELLAMMEDDRCRQVD